MYSKVDFRSKGVEFDVPAPAEPLSTSPKYTMVNIVDPAYPADRIPGSRIWIKLKIKLILLGGTI